MEFLPIVTTLEMQPVGSVPYRSDRLTHCNSIERFLAAIQNWPAYTELVCGMAAKYRGFTVLKKFYLVPRRLILYICARYVYHVMYCVVLWCPVMYCVVLWYPVLLEAIPRA